VNEEPIEIDICPDYGGCFNFGDGYASSFPEEIKNHPRRGEILAIEKALSVWADWFDTNDPHSERKDKFAWKEFHLTGQRLADELSEILGEGHIVRYCHKPLGGKDRHDIRKIKAEEEKEKRQSSISHRLFAWLFETK
jgi:hypothetical protein